MYSPRNNRIQSENKKSSEPYTYKSPQPRVTTKTPVGSRNQLSPNNADAKSIKSHRSRKSGRSARSNASMRSYETIHSRQMLSKYQPSHAVGYTEKQMKDSIDYIFQNYDSNRNNLLQRNQVLVLVRDALRHIGSIHEPTQLQIAEFIQHVDKNNDGQLSRQELQKTFLRASKSLN